MTTNKEKHRFIRHPKRVKKKIMLKVLKMIMIIKPNKMLPRVMKMIRKRHNISQI